MKKYMFLGTVLLLCLFLAVPVHAALTDNLVSYWKFDGDATDSVGSNDGTVNGATNSASYGKINQGYSFDGLNDNLIRNNEINSNQAYSVSVWFKTSSNNNMYFFDDGCAYRGGKRGIVIGINNGDMFYFANRNSYQDYVSSTGLTGYNDGNWHLIVLTWTGDGTSNGMKIYMDGSTTPNYQATTSSISSSTQVNSFNLGSLTDSSVYYNGDLDEVGIWSRVLTSTEVSQLYNAGSGLQYPFTVPTIYNNLTISANTNNFTVEVDGFGNYSTTSGTVTTDIVMNQSRTLDLFFYNATNGTENTLFYNRDYYNQILNSTNYTFNAFLYTSNPSPLNLTSPLNDTIHNSAINFTGNLSSSLGGFYICYLYTNETGSWAVKATNNLGSPQFNNQLFTVNNNYKWNILCKDGFDNDVWHESNFTFIYDDVEPIVNYLYPDKNNGTFTDQNFNFSLEIQDKNNYVTWVNVTYPNGSIMYTHEFNTTGTQTANLTDYLNNSVTGYYTMNVTAADGHTAKFIKPYDLKKENKEIKIKGKINSKTKKEEKISIYAKDKSRFNTPQTIKKKDRYEFEFTKSKNIKSKKNRFSPSKNIKSKKNRFSPDTFVVNTTGNIVVMKDSKYKGHVIIRDGDIHNWKWVDFETDEGYPVQVRKVNKHEVEVDVYGDGSGNYHFKSIGNLNVHTKIVQYYYDGNAFSATLTYDPVIANNVSSEYTLDYTLNPLVFTNLPSPSGSLDLNGTTYAGTVDSYTSTTASILTNAAVPISGEKAIINGNWTVDFYYVNGTSVTRSTSNFSQIVYNVTVGLCGGSQIYPIYNLTYYSEKSDGPISLTNGYDLQFYDSNAYYNLSGTFSSDNSNKFCTNVDPSDSAYNFQTTGTLTLSKTGYVTRYYDFEDGTSFISSNDPTTYDKYYLLDNSNSTSVSYTWLTSEFQNINGLMEISKCNANGTQSVVSIVPIVGGSVVANIDYVYTRYSYSVYVGGTKYSEESFTPCHVENSLTPTYYVTVSSSNPLPVTGLKSVTCSMDKPSDTTARMTWNSNPYSSESIQGCLVGYVSSFKGLVEVYRNCTNSTSYSLTRSIPDIGNEYLIRGELTQGSSFATCDTTLDYYKENTGSEIFGIEALLGVIFLILSMALFYAGDAEISIFGSVLGLLAVFFLGISAFTWSMVSAMIFFAIIIVVIGRYART